MEILDRAASGKLPAKIGLDIGEGFQIYHELVQEHLVAAKPCKNGMDIIMYAHNGVTEKGFSILQDHKERKETATSLGWLKHNRQWLTHQAIAFILGWLANYLS